MPNNNWGGGGGGGLHGDDDIATVLVRGIEKAFLKVLAMS